MQAKQQLFRNQRYLVRVLTIEDKDIAVKMFSDVSNKGQPIGIAFYRLFPQFKSNSLQDWIEFTTCYSQQLFESNLSVGCFDMTNNQLVGVSLCKKIKNGKIHQPFKKQSFAYPTVLFADRMYNQLLYPYNQIISQPSNSFVDIWGVAIKREHTGKRLLYHMIKANESLAISQKIKYSICWASNIKTASNLIKLNYQKALQIHIRHIQLEGVKYFLEIQQIDQLSSIWIKKLEAN